MSGRRKTYICKLDKADEQKELEFEIDFLRTLSIADRFKMMFGISNKFKRILIENGHRKPVEVIKRT